jgi:hypothetical protein
MVAAASIGGTAATATAATSAPAASCGWTAPSGPEYYILSKGGTADFWLSYDTCDGSVRGAMTQNSTNNVWELWVYNKTTGASATKWVSAVNENQYTSTIDGSGDYSHVCVQPYKKSGALTGAKICTDYYKTG